MNGSAEAPSLGNARGRQTPSRPRRFRPIGELNGNFHGNTTMSHDFFRGFPWFSLVFRCVPIFMGHFHGEHDDEPGWILGCSYNFQTIQPYILRSCWATLIAPRWNVVAPSIHNGLEFRLTGTFGLPWGDVSTKKA